MTSRAKASKKNASGDKGATSTRPSRLRVTRPEVEEVLRSPRRGRPKQQHKEEEEEHNVVRQRYDCAFQDEGDGREFEPPQLVWCKVRSHPWWPAQVFDAADASELALQHARAGAPLVAYFWDKTFAWSDASALLPFRTNFTRLAGQSTIFNFVSAVDAALQEVGRRVEAGLSCACFPATIAKKQEIENSGIREGAYGAVVDGAYMRDAFCGKPFLQYLSALGKNPMAGADRLDLATAKAQLRSFNRSRGTRDLPEYVIYQGIEDVAQVVPHTKRKIMEKSSGDDVPTKENKTRRGESSSRKREAPSEPAKKEAMDEGSSVPSRGATDDALSKGRKSKHRKSSAKKKEDTSKDADKRDAPAKKVVIVDDSSVTSRAVTDDTSSKERKSKDRKSSVRKKKGTSKDTDKREAVPKPTKEEATDQDSSMPSRGATDDTLSKKRKSKVSKSMAKKKDTSKNADGLETVGGSKMPAKKAMDGILSENKSGRILRSAHKMEEALEGLKGLRKDGGGETIKGEDKDAALLKEDNLGRRASSARKKDKITEGRDGLADGSARDSVSPAKKRSGRGETSVIKNVPISISEHGRKKKKLSELMAVTDTPNAAPSGKRKAGGKHSLHASTEKLEDPDRDMNDTMMTRKRKKLDTLGDFCSQAQPLSRKKSTKVGEMMHKGAGQRSQTPPVVKANGAGAPPAVKANGAASQTKSRRAKNRQVTVSDNSPHSMKVNRGKKDALTEDSLSCGEMLSQLRLVACDLKKIGKISPANASFFTDFKKSSYASSSDVEEEIPKKAGNTDCYASSSHADGAIPEKATNADPSPAEPPLADHMKDDYWADILINVEEPLSSLRKKKDKGNSRTNKKEHHAEKLAKKPSLSLGNTEEPRVERKQDSENGEQPKAETEPSGANGAHQLSAEEMENPLLAGLVLHFSRPGAVPSRSDLIKIFSQYGPVNEAKTEIANNANCAQVIFKRRMDAEAAFGGAGKISALGSALVSFRLTDFPSAASGNGPLQVASKSE